MTTVTPPDEGPVYVPVDEFRRARVEVSLSPIPTAGMMMFDSVQTKIGFGTPPSLQSTIHSHLRGSDLETLAPLTGRDTPPTSLLGVRTAPPIGFEKVICGARREGPADLDDAVEELAATDPAEFLSGVENCEAAATPGSFKRLRSDPGAWLTSYASALGRAWRAIEPLWRQTEDLRRREVERVHAAVARGVSADLLGSVHPRGTLEGERWRLGTADPFGGTYRLASTFVLAPMIADPHTMVAFRSESDALALGAVYYPLAGASRALDGSLPEPASLEALLGPQRAKILVRLERPASAGEIAETLQTTPGGATHHLIGLESAGLILRERRGRRVIVRRTRRGSELLDLYL